MKALALVVTFDHGTERFERLIARLVDEAQDLALPLSVFLALPRGDRKKLFRALQEIEGASLHLQYDPPGSVDAANAAAIVAAAGQLAEHHDGDGALLILDAAVQPDPGWIRANVEAIGQGAELVCGAIRLCRPRCGPATSAGRHRSPLDVLSRFRRMMAALEAQLDPEASDPFPRHQDESAVSLGITSAAYRRLGGLPQGAVRPVLQLIARGKLAGAALRHAVDCRVRVRPELFLANIPASGHGEEPVLVADPQRMAAFWRARSRLRAEYRRRHSDLPPAERERRVRALLALWQTEACLPSDRVPVLDAVATLMEFAAEAPALSPRPGVAGLAAAPGLSG